MSFEKTLPFPPPPSSSPNPKTVTDVKDGWVKFRVTVNTGAAGHVMLEALVPNMKLEHTGALENFVAVRGQRIRNMGEKTTPFKTSEGVHRSVTFGSGSVVKRLASIRKVVQAGNVVVLDESKPHLRNTRAGTTFKLDETGSSFEPVGAMHGICAISELVPKTGKCW